MKNIAVEVTEAVRKELGKIIPSKRTTEEKNEEVKKYGIEVIKFDAYEGKEDVKFKKEFRCHGYTLGFYESSIYIAHGCVYRYHCPQIEADFMCKLIDEFIQKKRFKN
ncbi:MAG TPA: hypothetical protein VGU44_01390 [Gammaproteobacteria bacterium]|nr:hypothetical protein [Gammaproteobacteria bacterium]